MFSKGAVIAIDVIAFRVAARRCAMITQDIHQGLSSSILQRMVTISIMPVKLDVSSSRHTRCTHCSESLQPWEQCLRSWLYIGSVEL